MNEEKISVVITCWDRKEYIIEALQSVVDQSLNRDKYEIVLVMGYENPEVNKFCIDYDIKNIIYNETNFFTKFLYTGILNAKYNVLSFLEDDDMFMHNKLEIIYNEFNKNKNLGYYHNITQEERYGRNRIFSNVSSITIRKNIINPDKFLQIDAIPDVALYLSALDSNYEIIDSKEVLTYYRIHGNNSSLHNKEWLKRRDESLLLLPKLYPNGNAYTFVIKLLKEHGIW
jgi:glycosyltransferase involved in cell wall biosynthesis